MPCELCSIYLVFLSCNLPWSRLYNLDGTGFHNIWPHFHLAFGKSGSLLMGLLLQKHVVTFTFLFSQEIACALSLPLRSFYACVFFFSFFFACVFSECTLFIFYSVSHCQRGISVSFCVCVQVCTCICASVCLCV